LRTTSTQSLDVLVSKYTDFEPSSGEPNGYQLFLANGSLSAFYMKNYSERVDFRAFGTNAGPVNDGLWHHVAFTVDGAGGKLYVDGVLRGTRVWQGSAGPVIPTNVLSFGYIGANGFPGQLDELTFWNTSLNAAGIQLNMNRRLTGSEPNLLALYHCDDVLGTLLYDATGLGHNGTLQYSASFGPSLARIQGLAQLSGRVTSAGIGFAGTPVSALLAPVSAPPLLPIPDNQAVTSTNILTLPGSIESMQVNVNITHPYRGDLELTLIHPDGTEVRLKNSDGTDAAPDILTSYPNLTLPVESLGVLNGKPIAGTWRLRVTDSFLLDSGVLNTWSLQFGPASVLTDGAGKYAFSNLFVGTYIVQPVYDGLVFNPESRTSAVDQTNVDFALASGFVSGRVLDNANGAAGVTISVGPGLSTTTDTSGRYRLVNLTPGNKTVTASRPGYSFSPGQIAGVPLGTTTADFQVVAYPVAGRITDINSNGVSGVSVYASSSALPGISGNNGDYFISNALPGSAIISPVKTGVTFSPPFLTRSIGPAVSNVNFIAIQSPPTLTTIKDQVIAKNGSTGPLRFDVDDQETPPARLQLSGTSSNPDLVPPGNIVFDGVGIQRNVLVTPAPNQFGTSLIYVTVSDESGLSTTKYFSLRVNQLPLPGVGLALNFDGINDVATGPSNAIADKGNYSVEAWVFAPSNPGPRTLVSQGGRLTLGFDAAGQIRASTNWTTAIPFPFGAWHHLALVRETDNTRLYLDGSLRASLGAPLGQPSQASPFQVGAFGAGEFWLGAIDELRIWRVARTASEIASNMLVRVTANEPNLGGLWRFDETAGSVASNSLPTAGALTLVNGPTRIQSPMVFDHYITLLGRNISDVLPGYDADGDPLTFALVSPPAHGRVTLLSSNSGAFVYTADGLGEDQFTFSVNDGFADSETHPLTILVLPDTNAPTISFLADKTIAEDTVLGPLPFVVNDTERRAELLPVFGQSSNPALVPDANITISGTGTNRAFTVRPATNQFGTATITLIVSDGSQQSTASFLLTVTPVNDAPTISVLTNQVVTRNTLNFGQLFTFQDVDTPLESLVLKATSDNSITATYGNYPNGDAGVARITPGGSDAKISITSSSIASGQSTVTVTADDGEFITTRSFTVIVNDPPAIAAIPNQSTFRNAPTGPISISLSDVDDPVANVVLTATSSNPALVDDSGFSFSGSGASRTLVITPAGGRVGQTTITVKASDAYHSSSQSFQLFVEGGLDYEVVVLPHLPGADRSLAFGLNENGKIVGWSAIGTSARAVVWDVNGISPTVTQLLPSSSVALSINNNGEIVGRNDVTGFYFANGLMTALPAALGTRCGVAINEGGDIVAGSFSGNVITYLNGATETKLTNVFYPASFSSEQRNLALNDLGDVFGLDVSLTRALVWRLEADKTTRTLLDLGAYSGSPYPLLGGINNVGQVCINSDSGNPLIYNYHTSTTSTNLQYALGLALPGAHCLARDMNDSGEVVGSSPAFLYADGRAFSLASLMQSSGFLPNEARAINAYGDIVGWGNGVTPFLLRRRWYVGQPQSPPLQAVNAVSGKVFRQPAVRALDGTPDSEVAQAYVWSDFEQRLFFLRPIQVEVSWFTTSNVLDTNSTPVLRRGRVVWPAAPQIQVAGAPVDCGPVDAASPYRPVAVAYTTSTGAILDATTRTFNSPNTGFSVIRYLLAPEVPLGGTPDLLTHSNYFEVVRTIPWNDPAFLIDSQPATIGTKVSDPRGPSVATNTFKSGWTIFRLAPYDGVGADRAYDRDTQTGPIIPVNRDSSASSDDLVVAFYKKNTLTGALWPDLPVRFTISWPSNPQKLVMANSLGSGPLPEDQYPDKRVYVQSSTNLPGFNPNEEHAFLAPTSSGQGVFALRNDLNRPDTSDPFVLLKYRNPTNSEWQFKVFQPVLTDATHVFTFNGEAGKEILPPYPLGLFTICPGTTNVSGNAFRDHQGKFYAASGPTPLDLTPQVIMRYSYPLQPGFFYDLNGDGTNDLAVGACVQWSSIPPGSSSTRPVDVTYRIHWPNDAPTLEIGETLLNAKHELPGIKNWASAQVVFDSLNPNGTSPLTNTARLYDPLSARVLRLTNVAGITASYRFPPEITLKTAGGNQVFDDLPFHLRSRLSYDPLNQALSFAGFLDDTVVGEPLLLINVLSDKERLRIKQLSGEPDFRRIIDALYDLTRNPNGVNLAHPGQSPPDQALLIGFTTKYIARVTNGVPPAATTSVKEFFGLRPGTSNLELLSTNIVQEPLGDAPKALTAGLPVPSAQAAFGSALQLDGNDFVSTSQQIAAPQTFTLSAWFRTTSTIGGNLIQFGDSSLTPSGAGDRFLALNANGAIDLYVFDNFGHYIFSPPGFNDGKWHHAAATFSPTTGMRLYADGNLVAQNTNVTFAYTYPNGGYWRLGESINGAIDEVQIWGVAQTADQIKAGMGHPATGSEPNLLRYWRFDEAKGTVAFDSTDNLADANLQGNPQRVASAVPGGPVERWVVLAENNDPALGALPVTLHVIRVFGGPFVGDLKIIPPDNVFDQRLTLRHSSDFGADPDKLEFEWWYHPDNADFDPTALPTTNPDGSIADPKGWLVYTPALTPNKSGQNTITIGDGGETSQFTLADNWFISRYRGYNIGGQTNWSDWVGDPSSDAAPRASLASGWIKRVLTGINPFEARTTDFHNNPASTFASMLIQAGHRYEGDIALNPSGENLLNIGLIETYTTVLNRGKSLSIDGVPPVDSDPLNNALLLAASRISDLYMLFGNEAFADAQDPTIGFFSDDLQFGTLATATFAFKNQLDSGLAEELCLLRGRDDTAAGVGAQPVYNRLLWNFTGSDGEVAYERTYNIGDVNLDGVINEKDARILFPQGHGDAWGHYLTAVTTYYDLLRHPRFTWIPRTESVDVAGTAVKVDFLDERKFANAAAAKAKTGTEIVDLTYRSKYVDDPQGQYQ
ncbi:MAG TPA: LamG-like jellyroll fold domain-containing protein, partial [Methylomirabilota bacterium]|nr:LamG-like jellyroll fold domain-containing protein [Methylomirabilota bacterium]